MDDWRKLQVLKEQESTESKYVIIFLFSYVVIEARICMVAVEK